MNYPTVLNEWETLRQLHAGKSIARYGDGELKLCRGNAAKAQRADKKMASRLCEILKSNDDRCLVGIPRIDQKTDLNPEKNKFWNNFKAPHYLKLYREKKIYGSAFITRPDSIPSINVASYYETMQSLWAARDVILIGGNNKPFDKNPNTLANVAKLDKWMLPATDAWDQYDDLLIDCLSQSKSKLFILALGPTASVLAFDLARSGYQALDLGHLGIFFNRFYNSVDVNVTTKYES